MLKDFGANKNGSNISARLIRSKNGKFYGMTNDGGDSSAGVIFSFDPKTSNYTTLKDLDFLNGSHPYGSLLQANDGKLYGMTTFGGESPVFFANWSELGVIFSFDPGSSKYTKLMDLSDYDGYAGGRPYGSLIQANDGKLYGMTSGNGSGYRGQASVLYFPSIIHLLLTLYSKILHTLIPAVLLLTLQTEAAPMAVFCKQMMANFTGSHPLVVVMIWELYFHMT